MGKLSALLNVFLTSSIHYISRQFLYGMKDFWGLWTSQATNVSFHVYETQSLTDVVAYNDDIGVE